MRFRGMLLGDMRFQLKYGFYFLYSFLTVVYSVILYFIPNTAKDTAATIIIFTDPATLGLFFMGAIILFEKSQRVLSTLAVSPIKIWEYIGSKIISLGFISIVVAVLIGAVAGTHNLLWVAIGTFLGSVLFSLLSIIIASKINSLNHFIILTIPTMLFFMFPTFAEMFGVKSFLFFPHAGNIILRLITGNTQAVFLRIVILLMWIALFYWLAYKSVAKMLKTVGGVKL